MIRAAIVGIGHWGRILVNTVQGKSTALRFTAGYTRTRAAAESFCAEHGIALRDDLAAILSDPAVDAVVFATPHSEHAAQVARAAAAGKHVFVEKPFALDLRSAELALDAAAKAGIVLGVAYHRRFHPAMKELRAWVRDGRLGALCHCATDASAPAGLFMPKDFWRADPREAPAGAMTAIGVHNVDSLIDLFGEIEEVYATSRQRAAAYGEDTTSVMFGLANGMSATLACTVASAVTFRLAVFGSKGCAEVVKPTLEFRFHPVPQGRTSGRNVAPEPEVMESPGFSTLIAELDAFAAAIGGGPAFPITAAEIRHGVAVFEAIVRSAVLREPVKVAR